MIKVCQQKKGRSKLNLLQHVESLFPGLSLKNAFLIGCQHILPSAHFFLRSLIDLGLPTAHIALIGKCYSTSSTTYHAMREEGIYVCPSSLQFDSHQSFDDQFKNNIRKLFEYVLSVKTVPKEATIILLDDGSELICMADHFFGEYPDVFGVEQTSSGYHKLRKVNQKIPVINVARSHTKLEVESPMIARSQMKQLLRKFEEYSFIPKNCLLIGNGAIGKKLNDLLEEHCNVKCFDRVKGRTDILKSELNFKNYDLIVGTTGTPIITEKDYHRLQKGTWLVSASSSDVEFEAVKLRRGAEQTTDCHKDIWVKELFVVNGGFPINFHDTKKDNVPLEDIQLTFALLLAGVCQGMLQKPRGAKIVTLHDYLQRNILGKFEKLQENRVPFTLAENEFTFDNSKKYFWPPITQKTSLCYG